MAISTAADLASAARQSVFFKKTSSIGSGAGTTVELNNGNGAPTSAGDTTSGLIADSTFTGAPPITSFGSGNTGYVTDISVSSTANVGRVRLCDRIFHAGAFACTSLTTFTLSSQPSATGRMPDGAGAGCFIIVEIVAGMAASATTIEVTYTNSAGTTGRTTGVTSSLSSAQGGRLFIMPLQAGDKGVRKIESVIVGGATNSSGTVNVIIARLLCSFSIPDAITETGFNFDQLGLPVVYDTSALLFVHLNQATAASLIDAVLTIANG